MANVDRKNGFRPAKSLVGAPWTALVRDYPAIAGRSSVNNSGDIYIGDVVKLTAGNAEPVDADTDAALGVVVAVGKSASETALNTDNVTKYYDPDNLSKRYLAHDEAGYVGVVPAEACLFAIQSAPALVAGAAATYAITGTTTRGNRTTGNSIQSAIAGGTALTVVELVTAPDNDPTDANASTLVKFNVHQNAIN